MSWTLHPCTIIHILRVMINFCSPAAAKILSSIANQQVEVNLGSYNFIVYRLSVHYKRLKIYNILVMFSNRTVTIFVAVNYWHLEPMQYCTDGNLLHTLDCMLMIMLVIRSVSLIMLMLLLHIITYHLSVVIRTGVHH